MSVIILSFILAAVFVVLILTVFEHDILMKDHGKLMKKLEEIERKIK